MLLFLKLWHRILLKILKALKILIITPTPNNRHASESTARTAAQHWLLERFCWTRPVGHVLTTFTCVHIKKCHDMETGLKLNLYYILLPYYDIVGQYA